MPEVNNLIGEKVYVVVKDKAVGTTQWQSTNICVCSHRVKAEYVISMCIEPHLHRIEEYIIDLWVTG